MSGHQIYATSESECAAADAWLERSGLSAKVDAAAAEYEKSGATAVDATLDKVFEPFVDLWSAEANVKTYGESVADVMRFLASEGFLTEVD